jgi:F0F1-type ATP synthase assembly protein I
MPMPVKNPKLKSQNNILIAVLVGQVGVLVLVIVLAAGLGGLALDAHFGTKPWITVGLLVASIPVTFFLMLWMARKTVAKIRGMDNESGKEEDAIEKDL